MPEMDGFKATEEIMAECPTPILILSSLVNKNEAFSVFNAIQIGALDAMEKPNISNQEAFESIGEALIKKIKVLSKIPVIRHIKGKIKGTIANFEQVNSDQNTIVVIGASTGGPQILRQILKEVRIDFPFPIVVVQHMSRGFMEGMIEWLNRETPLRIKLAEDEEKLEKGTVYVAPDDYFCLVKYPGIIILDNKLPKWTEHKPCVNYLFKSAAEEFGDKAIGVLLTGMGKDGAEGLKLMKLAGSMTICQDEESSIIFGMPKVAIEMNAVKKIMKPEEISSYLNKLTF